MAVNGLRVEDVWTLPGLPRATSGRLLIRRRVDVVRLLQGRSLNWFSNESIGSSGQDDAGSRRHQRAAIGLNRVRRSDDDRAGSRVHGRETTAHLGCPDRRGLRRLQHRRLILVFVPELLRIRHGWSFPPTGGRLRLRQNVLVIVWPECVMTSVGGQVLKVSMNPVLLSVEWMPLLG